MKLTKMLLATGLALTMASAVSLPAQTLEAENNYQTNDRAQKNVLEADIQNVSNQLQKLSDKKSASQEDQLQLASLKARLSNLKSRMNVVNDVNAKEAAEKAAAKAKQVEAQQKAQVAAAQAQQARQAEIERQQSQPTKPAAKSTTIASTEGLDMNQTHGKVNIQALANWLAVHKGTFSADYWAYVINRESNGLVDAQNPSSGAYGVLQLYGHGEHPGMTLGEQLQMAMPLPASAWYLY